MDAFGNDDYSEGDEDACIFFNELYSGSNNE